MIFSKLKTYGIVIAGGALTVLLTIVKVLSMKNSRLRERVEHAEAKVHIARVVARADTAIERQTESHRADLINELKDTDDSSAFRDPNKLFDDGTD